MIQAAPRHYSETAILGRLLGAEPDEDFSPERAKFILELDLSHLDRVRCQELSAKARAGTLASEEQDELNSLIHVADLLSTWQSRARHALHR